jgi:hypothetical protein
MLNLRHGKGKGKGKGKFVHVHATMVCMPSCLKYKQIMLEKRRLSGPHSQTTHFGEEKNPLSLLAIMPVAQSTYELC